MAGYSTAPLLTQSSFLQLFELRLPLGPVVARKTAIRLIEEDLLALEQLLQQMQEVQIGQPYQEYQHLAGADAAFHAILVRTCGDVFFSGYA